MTWWCTATRLPWSWTEPRAYPGVWAFIAALVITSIVLVRRSGVTVTARQKRFWLAGVLLLWIASDWPVGALGSGYLASGHMLQYLLYTHGAAPLLLLSIPTPLAMRALGTRVIGPLMRATSRSMVAIIITNAIMLFTHAPWTVDNLRVTEAGSFVLDVLWLLGGLVLWLPIVGPLKELQSSPLAKAAHLFFGAGVTSLVPAGFLTFSDKPLYSLYELSPRVAGWLDPVTDQQAAGLLMKLGMVPVVWATILAILVRWAANDRKGEPPTLVTSGANAEAHPTAPSAPKPTGLH